MAKVKKEVPVLDDLDLLIQETGAKKASEVSKIQQTKEVYSTGSFALDLAIGVKSSNGKSVGVPSRTIMELYGRTGSFKSGTALNLAKSVLDADPSNRVFILFSEEAFMPRLEALNLDMKRIITFGCYDPDEEERAKETERGLNALCQFSAKPEVKLCIIDSLGALTCHSEVYDDSGNLKDLGSSGAYATRAVVVTKFLAQYGKTHKDSILVMTNHQKDTIQTGFTRNFIVGEGLRPKTLCGTGKDFLAHLRIECSTRPLEDEVVHPLFGNKPQYGMEILYKVVKNWFCPKEGSRKVSSKLYFENGKIREAEDVFNFAEYLGIIERQTKVSWEILGEKVTYRDNCIEYIDQNEDVKQQLKEQILLRAEDELFKSKKIKAKELI